MKIKKSGFMNRVYTLLLGLMVSLPISAWAVPAADFKYVETQLGPSSWQYNYTLYNTSAPGDPNLFGFAVGFDPLAIFTAVSPAGWDTISGPGYIQATTMTNEIPVGGSTTGFVFTFDYQAGSLPFEALFRDPNSDSNYISYVGASSVPEPSTFMLLSCGMGALVLLGRRNFNV